MDLLDARHFILFLLMVAALAVALAFVGFLWQRQRRKVAEHAAAHSRALNEYQARYRQLFENMPSGVAIYHAVDEGADFVFAGINGAVERIEHVRREDVFGRRVTEVFPGVVEFGLLEVLRRVWRTGEAEHFPIAFYRDKRISGWRDNQVYRLPGSEVVAIYDDVTARKQAEESLRESEERFRSIFENALDGILLADVETRQFIMSNRTICQMLGYGVEEMLRLGVADIHREQDLPHVVEQFEKLSRGEIELAADIPVRRKDGSVFYADIKGSKIHIGDRTCLIGIFRDITERKHTDERIRQAATVFESTHDGVTIADLDGNILAVNKAFTEITGYSEAEVLGRNPRILKSGRQKCDFYQAMWAGLLSTGQWQGEIWNRRKNGEIYPEWLTINVVRNERGEPTHYVGVFTDISKLKQGEEQMDRLAHYDPLTSLPNRLLLQSRLAHAVERAGRCGYRVGVLFIDLDRFKTVNDSFGHTVGDELLVAVVERLKGRVRDEDTLGRLGGDEFMLMLEPLDELQQAATVARDLLDLLAAPFRLSSGHDIFVGASIGVSVFPEDGDSATDLLRDADAAMYRAKELGRNRFCFYTADMNADAVAQLELESALRRALERDELVLHYQPKVDLRSGRMSGAEALIRWQRDGHLVPPIMFIPLAERTGLIVAIGNWVIDVVCRQLRAWIDAGLGLAHVAVNVSSRQFLSGDLKRVVSEALARHGVPPECLELELTESMLMEDHDRAVAMLDELRALGVRLSLDDFGTGYSSFGYLSRFAIDTLKIDQSFVRGIATEPGAALIAVAIIDLAHRMKLRVVAEGVETEAQLGYLRMRGCDEMQGYLFSRPVPAGDFAELLRQEKSLPPMVKEGAELRTLLIVDDEPDILSALGRALRGEDYRVLAAGSAKEGLELLATNDVQVILSDQRMPVMSGTEFLGRAKDIHPDTVRIVLSGYTDLESVTRLVNEGAIYKFLTKPWDDEQLRGHIREAFLYHDAIIKPRAAGAS
ncbi:MAG: EAL domain-containing protein [Candidatus Nitricoxidivorans perseverans]|uniref:EAL domain-containing protein n=1 Tax=Candidatus Nitricoxidivorans perseverans TaxID=2975601 RepID=A0AA49IZD5_9PROT|nr:MAG: EAL domain-containing protein [Candidatus Nitricoxidivorans perseverans]